MAKDIQSDFQQQIQTLIPNVREDIEEISSETQLVFSVLAKIKYKSSIGIPQTGYFDIKSFRIPLDKAGILFKDVKDAIAYVPSPIYGAKLINISSLLDTWNIGDQPKNIELVLDKLKSQLNVRDLQAILSEIQDAYKEDTNEHLVKLLKDSTIPSINRWAILEFLTTKRYPELLPIILKHVSSAKLDEFLDGCTIALRIIDVPLDARGELVKLMRSQVTSISPWAPNATPLHRRIFGDTLLVLASYGDEQDIPLLLGYIAKDLMITGEFMVFLMEGLRRLLIRTADKVNSSVAVEIRLLAEKLLSIWANPLAIKVEMGMFHRGIYVIKMLCARLDKPDLELVRSYAIASQDTSFVRLSLEAIQQTEYDLNLVAMSDWCAKHTSFTEEIKNDLKKYLAANVTSATKR